MKTVGKTDVYLPLLRITGIFNMTGNVNLQDFTTVPPDLNLTLARVQCTTDPQLSSNTREQS